MAEPLIVSVADAPAERHPTAGAAVMFEHPERPFPELAINVRILLPGQSNACYRAEN